MHRFYVGISIELEAVQADQREVIVSNGGSKTYSKASKAKMAALYSML